MRRLRLARPITSRVAPVVVAIALVGAACSGGNNGEGSTTSPVSLTVPPSAPASYAAVVEDFESRRLGLLSDGREVVDQLLSDDPAAIEQVYERTSKTFQEEFSLEFVQAGLREVHDAAAIGERLDERAAPLGLDGLFYAAEFDWDRERLRVTVGFDGDGVIQEMFAQPVPPVPAASSAQPVSARLPFDGLWWTFWGGDEEIRNYHVIAPDQRHAFDFVVWKDGATHTGTGEVNRDYWAWGQPALAPVAGLVVAARDGVADSDPQDDELHLVQPAGNHVLIETDDGWYVLVAHLQQGSVEVAEGAQIEVGDRLGLVGNSGNSSEPHVHIHAQDGPDLFQGDGVPIDFGPFLADGQLTPSGAPAGNQFAQSAPS